MYKQEYMNFFADTVGTCFSWADIHAAVGDQIEVLTDRQKLSLVRIVEGNIDPVFSITSLISERR
jgi:hypothetical protein